MIRPTTLAQGRRLLARAAFAMLLPLTLAACGGGSGEQLAGGGIVGTGDAGLVAVGTVSAVGSGSVTVNGVVFATSGAKITVNGQAALDSALKVGMVVTTQGRLLPAGGAQATAIDYRSEVQGVVSGVDSASTAFTVLGQRVRTDAQTVFDGGTFATLINQYVDVSGFRSAPGEVLATRVEIRPVVAVGAPLTVRGTVFDLDAGARTFRIGAQLVDYAGVAAAFVPPSLANGSVVDVQGVSVGAGDRLVASAISIVATTVPGVEATHVEIEGVVTDFAGIDAFRVNGQLVDGSAATITGVAGASVANGAKVEVEGRLTAGVVVATKIEIEQAATVTIDGKAEALDVAGGTVTVAGQVLTTTPTTQFEDKSVAAVREFGLAAIRVGDRLVVRAARAPTRLVALRIERVDAGAPPGEAREAKAEGIVSAFVSVADFMVGTRKVNASSARFEGGVAADLANGKRVSAEGTLSGDVLMATKVEFESIVAPPGEARVEGTITDFLSPASFKVAGQPVDASGATFEGGGAGDLANGRRVEAEGTIVGGVLVARKVSIDALPVAPTVEVEGRIASFVSVASFVVDGQKVDASRATFKNGTAGDLADGRDVTAKGPVVAGVLQTATIEFHDSGENEGVEAEGKITNYVSPSNFVVAGRVVDASNATFSHGTIADLANGKAVEVHGTLVGQVLKATQVEFK